MQIIFLTYQNRSGSTFLANQLSRHKNILVCPEAEILVSIFLQNPNLKFKDNKENVRKIENKLQNDLKFKFWNLTNLHLSNLTNFENFVNILTQYKNKTKPEAEILLFKSDRLIHLFDRIQNQNTRFISIIRDPRAVFLSQKNTIGSWQKPMNTNPINSAVNWEIFVEKSNQFSQNHKSFYQLKYENLITNFDTEFNQVLLFIFNNNVDITQLSVEGDLFERLPNFQKHFHTNITQKPIIENIEKWKTELSEFEIAIIEKIAKKSIILNNYECLKIKFRISNFSEFCCFISKHFFTNLKSKIKNLIHK